MLASALALTHTSNWRRLTPLPQRTSRRCFRLVGHCSLTAKSPSSQAFPRSRMTGTNSQDGKHTPHMPLSILTQMTSLPHIFRTAKYHRRKVSREQLNLKIRGRLPDVVVTA